MILTIVSVPGKLTHQTRSVTTVVFVCVLVLVLFDSCSLLLLFFFLFLFSRPIKQSVANYVVFRDRLLRRGN